MIAVFVGVMFLILGAFGAIIWLHDLVTVVRGFGTLSLILGGILAVIFGIASLTSPRVDGKKEK